MYKADEYLSYRDSIRNELFNANDEMELLLLHDVTTENEYEAFINLYNQIYKER